MNEKREVYNQIVENNLLKGISLDLVQILSENELSMTVGEVFRFYRLKYPKTKRSRGELSKRMSDLKNWGVVKTTGFKKCPLTNRSASLYTLTGNLPNKDITAINNIEKITSDLSVIFLMEKQINDAKISIKFIKSLYLLANFLFFVPSFKRKLDHVIFTLYNLQSVVGQRLEELNKSRTTEKQATKRA